MFKFNELSFEIVYLSFKKESMKKAFVILLLLLTKSISLFAQTNYDIKVLGALNNKIEFDTSLNWYAIEIKNSKELSSKQRFVKINLKKDIKVKSLMSD